MENFQVVRLFISNFNHAVVEGVVLVLIFGKDFAVFHDFLVVEMCSFESIADHILTFFDSSSLAFDLINGLISVCDHIEECAELVLRVRANLHDYAWCAPLLGLCLNDFFVFWHFEFVFLKRTIPVHFETFDSVRSTNGAYEVIVE